MTAFEELFAAMTRGRGESGLSDNSDGRALLGRVYDERYHAAEWQKNKYQVRSNLKRDTSAPYAAWITSDNPTSGPYQGTSFVWFPGDSGSVAALVIGTDGFGQDTGILGRPGHRRRLRALGRLHRGQIWVKPDLLDVATSLPRVVSDAWPPMPGTIKAYGPVVYAAVVVRDDTDRELVEDLLDLFFFEHATGATGKTGSRWKARQAAISAELFPRVDEELVFELLRERRFVVLEGPPGTGKTRLAYRIAERVGSHHVIQFHPARTYEDFVVGLHPKPTAEGLAFEVRPGDLLRANQAAADREHVLVIDELNRADLGRVLGESIILFEPGETERAVQLPYTPEGFDDTLRLHKSLFVLGTRNTADRSIARIDLAIRRRFAFVDVWPDLRVVAEESTDWARDVFDDVLTTFAEFADDEVLRLVPGHSYLLDPRPDLDSDGRERRVVRRVERELLPLLRDYLDERLTGGASEQIAGLLERIESRVLGVS